MDIQTLISALQNVNGSSFVGIDTLVEVKLTGGKKNPQQNRITKRTVGSQVMVFQNRNINGYEAMVRRRLEQEGKDPDSFVLGPRAWGQRQPNSPIVEHTKDNETKYYLEVIFLRAGQSEYLQDGQPIAEADIQGLPEVKHNETAQGGLDRQVVIRSYSVDSIVSVRVGGQTYQ